MAKTSARSVSIARALMTRSRSIDWLEVGKRLAVTKPDRPQVKGEDPQPLLQIVPLGETTERVRQQLTRRPVVNLIFSGVVDEKTTRDDWIGIAERYLSQIEDEKMAGFTLETFQPESQWDPGAAKAGRFAALYRAEYVRVDFV